MKINYKFDNGDISAVEVPEDIGNIILEDRRKEENADRKWRRHCQYSIDALDFEGEEYGRYDDYGEVDDEQNHRQGILRDCFDRLTKVQRRRLLLYIKGMTLEEIATVEGVSFQSVDESLKAARKKFPKNF